MMKRSCVTLIVLLSSLFVFAMSDSPKEEPKKTEILESVVQIQSGDGFITKEELNRIAINFYKYMFEEEHEWKGIKVDPSKSVIKSIAEFVDGERTLAYLVNYEPTGHIMFLANKNLGSPLGMNGNDSWFPCNGETKISIDDTRLHFFIGDWFIKMKESLDSGKNLTTEKDLKWWNRLNVPIENFNERANFDQEMTPPEWWLEKKKLKNTQGMIKTEWHQYYPYNLSCPLLSNSNATVTGCNAVALSQLMKYYEWPNVGIGSNSYSWFNGATNITLSETFSNRTYDWSNMLAYDSLMTQAQKEEVAKICRDTGIAMNSNYGDSLTSTVATFYFIPHALSRHFNYTSQLRTNASWYSSSNPPLEWIDSLKSNLTLNGPIIYGGYFSSGSFSGDHTWLINDYSLLRDQFHYNLGEDKPGLLPNDYYPLATISSSQFAVFNTHPDNQANSLSIPYKEDFQEVTGLTGGSALFQIPKFFGISHTLDTALSHVVMSTIIESESENKALAVTNSGENSQWFVLKKINLACDSVPILKFKFRILDESGLVGAGTDGIIVEVSNDDRLTWNQIYSFDKNNYKQSDFNIFLEKIISLNGYKNEIINIRFRFPYSGTATFCYIDDIEVGKLLLSFPELTNDMTLSPKTAQSIKVTTSIATPPKSKGFENYDMIMDFYIAKDGDNYPIEPNHTDSICENGIFEYPDWNTDDSLGVTFNIRAVARTKSSPTTLTSTEVRVKISGRECHVDLPLPATETWFDFETRLNFELSILAEAAFADSLDNVYIGFDVYDDYNTETNGFPISIFEWYYPEYFAIEDSTVYFCEFEKKAESIPAVRKPISPEVLQKIKETKPSKRFFPANENTIKKISKDLTSFFALSYRYPHSLDLVPGTYTVSMMAIRKDIYDNYGLISEIAKSDSSQFIIPQWKMKLRRDYWFANTVVPYKQNLEYEAGKIMQIIFWRPWPMPPFEPLYLDIVRETDNTVVQSYEVDFNSKAAYDLIEWTIPSETIPGFYNLKARNLDYWTNITVNQQIDPQVCPLYLSWENSGDWPVNWPGEDSQDWDIHSAQAWTPAMGAYALGANYNTEGNTGELSIQKSVSVDSEWDRVLEFSIGVQKFYGVNNFDPLLADYSIATSRDGANWTIEKTADINDYLIYTWSVDTAYCFNKYFRPLGSTSNVGIKFIKKGIVTSPPDNQSVLFDEVKVMLTKTPLKTGPTDPSAQYAGGNVNVGWSGAVKSSKAVDNYYVYRNGIKIGETTTESYVDSTVYANTFYNYSITAHYDDGSLYPESPMNECSVSIYTGLFSPSNLVITNENPNIKLTWSSVSGASEYKVYSSNDPYGTFTEDTSGTFDGEEWVAPLTQSKLFYYVVAVNESMKVKKIFKTFGNQVK